MPLPVIIGVVAAVAATGGTGAGVYGAANTKKASGTFKRAVALRDEAVKDFELQNSVTSTAMDELGTLELDICSQFQEFSDVIEMIQGRPEFKEYDKDGVTIPKYDPEELKKVSVGAGVIIGGLVGSALGTAGGFAAAGATTAAVAAWGTASTGVAIAHLSGAAATNATLAALGGGAVAAGGGGMALGSTMLGVSTAGIGILVGGIIFSITGSVLSKKADEAYFEAMKIEHQVEIINRYLVRLHTYARKYHDLLSRVKTIYDREFSKLKTIVIDNGKTQWSEFTGEEKAVVYNTVLLVGLLFKMCQVTFVNKAENPSGVNSVNVTEIDKCMDEVTKTLEKENLESEVA